MVKRFSNVKKEKKPKTYHEGKSPIRVKEDQIGKKYISIFKVSPEGNLELDVSTGAEVIVLRYQYGTPGEWHPGTITGIEDDGTVKFWDETLEQWLYFNWRAENVPAVLRKNV